MSATSILTSDAFADTNILVYLVTDDEPKARRSERLLEQGVTVSVQVLNEFVLVARRKLGRSWDDIRAILTGIRGSCVVLPVSIGVHERGLAYAERYGLRMCDAMVVAAAVLAGCSTLYSEDMHDGLVIDGVTIRNPYKG